MSDHFVNLILKNFFKITFTIVILGFFFYIFLPFMVAIVLGGILAMALIPFVDFFMRRGLSRNSSLLLFTTLLGIAGLIPLIAFVIRGSRVVAEFLHESNFAQYVHRINTSSFHLIDRVCAFYGVESILFKEKFTQLMLMSGNFISTNFNTLLSEIPTIVMMGLITLISLYCFLRESEKIRALFDRYFYLNHKNGNNFIRMFKVCCREVFFLM
jgi:predicted PurR-regulated permease PerM